MRHEAQRLEAILSHEWNLNSVFFGERGMENITWCGEMWWNWQKYDKKFCLWKFHADCL